jgi:DNA-binding NtrC family response regulator
MNTPTSLLPHTIPSKADQRSQTILVVDDEGLIRDLIWCQLTALGYHVLTASGGADAQDMLLGYGPGDIDLLITDLNMPLMRGDELAEWFQSEYPGAKVLLMSSHVNTANLGKNLGFLPKPFRIETLGGQVREFLGSDSDIP